MRHIIVKTSVGIFISLLLHASAFHNVTAQQEIVDQVVAIVGNNIVLQSDVENQVLQIRTQGSLIPRDQLKCEVLEDLLAQKLLLNQD